MSHELLLRNRTDSGPAPQSAPDVRAFHAGMEDYRVTPLVRADSVADAVGVRRVWVKDESDRFGLPAFKILGVTWAAGRAITAMLPGHVAPPTTFAAIREALVHTPVERLVAATAGNHGRAVAHTAARLGLSSTILVPASTPQHRIAAIAKEGADVSVVAGSYDDAVRLAVALGRAEQNLLLADTAWPGYGTIPGWVVEGYATLFEEIDEQLVAAGDTVASAFVQIGVGSLAAAAANWASRRAEPPTLVGVESIGAACVLASARAGRMVEVPGPHTTRMVGVAAGLPSLTAFDLLMASYDAFVAVSDDCIDAAVDLFATAGVVAGETGVAGLVALLELREADDETRAALGLAPENSVLLVCSEGRSP